jgi:hypothetical protein
MDWVPDETNWPDLSLSQLEECRLTLNEECQRIQTQLGDKHKIDDEGNRLPFTEYNAWRQKAKYALTKKREVYNRLNRYIKDRRQLADLHEKKKDRARSTKNALLASAATVDQILGMSVAERRELVYKCEQAAELLENAEQDREDSND